MAVDDDDLKVLLVDPDFALEVMLPFDQDLGTDVENVGVEFVDFFAAEVGEVVFGKLLGGEDEGQAVDDFIEIGGRHDDALKGVLRGECDVLLASALAVEGDVCDLYVLAVRFTASSSMVSTLTASA